MRKLITSVILLCSLSSWAQNDDYVPAQHPKLLSADRVSGSVSAGAGVLFGSNSSTGYGTFIAPKLNYQLTNKFSLQLGLVHYSLSGSTFYPLNTNEALYNPSKQAVSGNLISIGGTYQLNKRLDINGAVMMNAFDKQAGSTGFKAAALGLDYKVTDRSTISIQTVISAGSGNYLNNPMMNPVNSGSSMFGSSFGTFH